MTVEVVVLMVFPKEQVVGSVVVVVGSVVVVLLMVVRVVVVVAHLWRSVLMVVVVVAHLWRSMLMVVVMVFPKEQVVGSVVVEAVGTPISDRTPPRGWSGGWWSRPRADRSSCGPSTSPSCSSAGRTSGIAQERCSWPS